MSSYPLSSLPNSYILSFSSSGYGWGYNVQGAYCSPLNSHQDLLLFLRLGKCSAITSICALSTCLSNSFMDYDLIIDNFLIKNLLFESHTKNSLPILYLYIYFYHLSILFFSKLEFQFHEGKSVVQAMLYSLSLEKFLASVNVL